MAVQVFVVANARCERADGMGGASKPGRKGKNESDTKDTMRRYLVRWCGFRIPELRI